MARPKCRGESHAARPLEFVFRVGAKRIGLSELHLIPLTDRTCVLLPDVTRREYLGPEESHIKRVG